MSKHKKELIRNFSIIAHIDHGKSTLADRFLEITKTVSSREMKQQYLDTMELERERGITIKARPVTMYYHSEDGNTYQINLIDTPGHVDFSYEVSRSLSACEGALLVVDATQGVQAQTLANVHLALERDLEIIPVLNKVDLPASNPALVRKQIEDVIGIPAENALEISAKTGQGVKDVLEMLIKLVPPPLNSASDDLKALIFDSQYDSYRGVIVYVRVVSGEIERGMSVKTMATNKNYQIEKMGIFSPNEKDVDSLKAGEVGFIVAGIKNTADIKVGDTITLSKKPASTPLAGFKLISPVVYAGIYPIDSPEFENLRDALVKLQLNDSALKVEQESSLALGFGFRCGFLGLLHLEIVFERLQREFNLDIITTSPSVIYKFTLTNDQSIEIDNPALYPDSAKINYVEEPWVICRIMAPADYLGPIMNLSMDKRGELVNTETMGSNHLLLTYRFPLNEIITDFNDKLKSVTKGFGSFDYEFNTYEISDIIKLEIRVNEEPVDAFSLLVHKTKAESKGRAICKKLKEVIPPQLFKVPIQAAIGGKIIARETIGAVSKNVTAKCYGGDISRKRKLWEKQKKGKKKMKEIGKVNIPQSAFMEVLKAE